ncbi:ABC transporter permease [Myxococcus stipitatus]|uniref:ABC transporter permease n=1 Tax=Myxococcus stipitatus TaxID=83455 RepID=UPI0003108DF2|nr:ABC transporter permease [Myxococcus stipitatus]
MVLLALWGLAVQAGKAPLMPSPWQVVVSLGQLAMDGRLVRFTVASLFRVTWGLLWAGVIAIPLGIWLGWSPRAERALGPVLQLLRPISSLAWTPLAILWCGVGDLSAIFIIFMACFGPLMVNTLLGVRKVLSVHLNAGRNFGLSTLGLMRRVVWPSLLPQLLTSLRQTLGVAWMVVVMAEMMAVNSGLGFLILDARNAGNRYDLVVAGMVLIGAVGLGLDALLRSMERIPALSWGFPAPAPSSSTSRFRWMGRN